MKISADSVNKFYLQIQKFLFCKIIWTSPTTLKLFTSTSEEAQNYSCFF